MRQFAAESHTGIKRSHNEDCYEADPVLGLWLVADGVGGHSCGEVASDIARSTIRDCIARGETLPEAIENSHRAILKAIKQNNAARGMGSTVVAILINDDNYELSWVGDSRAYLWDNRLQQLSQDHNRASELLAGNMITQLQAVNHPERHVLTQSLGVSDKMHLRPGHVCGSLSDGQQILLCSDGLTDELPDSVIARIMADNHSPRAQVDALVLAALEAGGNDNITAVVVGACADNPLSDETPGLDTTLDIHRADDIENSRRGSFPFRAWLLVSALTLLALWFLL